MTKAQWTMLLVSIFSTALINGAVTIFVNQHTTEVSLEECSDRLYFHITD